MAKAKVREHPSLESSVQNLAWIVAFCKKENMKLYNKEKEIKKKFQAEVERLNKEIQILPEYITVKQTQSLLSQYESELYAVSIAKRDPEKVGLEYSSGKVIEVSDYDKFHTYIQQAVETLQERLLTRQKTLDKNLTYQSLTTQLKEISKEMESNKEVIKIHRENISVRDEISKTLDVLYKLIELYPEEEDRIRKEYESALQQFSDSEKSFSSSSSSSDSSSSLSSSYSSSSSSSLESTTSETSPSSSSASMDLISLASPISSSLSDSTSSEEVHSLGDMSQEGGDLTL